MTEFGELQYYLLFLIVLLIGSLFYNLRQRYILKVREESELELVKEAYFNPITELPNRQNIDIMITEQIHRVHRRAKSFLIVIIRVKNYNDINLKSKNMGDEFISEAGSRIVDTVREEDMVSHISDNTFAILFNEYLEEDNCKIILKRLKAIFKDNYQIEVDKSLEYEIGMGYSKYPDNGTDGDTLVNEAIHEALK